MNNEFLKQYQICIIDDNKRCAKPLRAHFFVDPIDSDIVNSAFQFDSEPLLTITIPESQLRSLEYMDGLIRSNRESAARGNLLEVIIDQKNAERQIRHNNAAVQQAYEHYSTLLYLAGHQDRIKL